MAFVKLTWADRAEVVELGAGGSVKVEVPAVSGLQSWQFASSGLLGVEVCDEPAAESEPAAAEEPVEAKPAPAPKKPAAKKAPAKKPAAKPKTAAKKPAPKK